MPSSYCVYYYYFWLNVSSDTLHNWGNSVHSAYSLKPADSMSVLKDIMHMPWL